MRIYIKVIITSIFVVAIFWVPYRFIGNDSMKQDIRLFTTGYTSFTGWDWIVNKSNIALGTLKSGPLRDFQHKIHYFDENVDIFKGGEFFCDPDDIVFIPETGEVSYLPYLKWRKDLFINNEGTLGRLSFIHGSRDSYKDDVLDTPPLSGIDIKIDKTLSKENHFIDSRVYLTNQKKHSTDIVYITQDAAYMFLPDQSQNDVLPIYVLDGSQTKDQFVFGKLSAGDMVATYNRTKFFVGGYVVRGKTNVWGGVVPEYAFFKSHSPSSVLPGFADVKRSSYKDVAHLIKYLSDISNNNVSKNRLKNRILLFHFEDVKPGETAIATFYQFGSKNIKEMERQLAKNL